MKKTLLLILFLYNSLQFINAQQQTEYIDRNFKLDLPIDLVGFSGEGVKPMLLKGTVHIEVINFGERGNTVIVDFDQPEVVKELGKPFYYSWSGKNVHLVKTIYNGSLAYLILRGNINRCAAGAMFLQIPKDDKQYWFFDLTNGDGSVTCNYEIHKGMSRAELESHLNEYGMRFEHTGNQGNLRVWSLKWLSIDQVYNLIGNNSYYSLNNDRKYIDFYFSADDKLVKWIYCI